MLKYFSLFLFLICFIGILSAQPSPAGVWQTVDDESNEPKSYVEIYSEDGKYFGKVVKLLQDENDIVCDKCSGANKDKPILGMIILEDLTPSGDYWKNGTILDPANGNNYGCSVWFDKEQNEELKVRGKHWTGLYRTQTWYKVK